MFLESIPKTSLSCLALSSAVVGLVGLAPTDALASRTIHIQTRAVNHTNSDVFVHIQGDYVQGPMEMSYPEGGAAVQLVGFDGDDFGVPKAVDNVTGLAALAAPDYNLAQNLKNDFSYTVTTGHTHHFTATFYEDVGNGYRAFASYEWIAQVNLTGVNQCHPVKRVDPQQRIVGAHKRPETTSYGATLYDKGFTASEIEAVIEPAMVRRGMSTIIDRTAQQYGDLYRMRNQDTYGTSGFGELIATGPGTCLTQFWVLPPVEEEEIEMTQIGMLAWGASGYSFVGDFNGDGISDLASAYGQSLYMAPSRGPWYWDQLQIDTGSSSWGGAGYTYVGDFDGDGMDDIASANGGTVFVRRASQGFQVESWPVNNQWGAAGYTWAADFNGDGKTDIATASGGTIFLRLSTGTGFAPQILASVPSKWGSASYTRIGDFNGDGKADIASANGGVVYVRLATGSGFTHQEWTLPGNWGASGYTFVGDYNGDGKDDFASIYGGSIYTNLSTGTGFAPQVVATVPNQWGDASYTRTGDWNGDGKTDIASAYYGTVFLNIATGTGTSTAGFQGFTREAFAVDDWWGAAGYTFVGDFDQDGLSDFATAYGGEVQIKFRR